MAIRDINVLDPAQSNVAKLFTNILFGRASVAHLTHINLTKKKQLPTTPKDKVAINEYKYISLYKSWVESMSSYVLSYERLFLNTIYVFLQCSCLFLGKIYYTCSYWFILSTVFYRLSRKLLLQSSPYGLTISPIGVCVCRKGCQPSVLEVMVPVTDTKSFAPTPSFIVLFMNLPQGFLDFLQSLSTLIESFRSSFATLVPFEESLCSIF